MHASGREAGINLNAILQLESQGEYRESATEVVLMVGYTSDGIFNQEQTRWLSWNVDGGVRGFDLAKNSSLSNTTEYSAGEFPLPTKPQTGTGTQSISKPFSMIRSQQKEESYPDLSNLNRELERAQREGEQANLERDKVIVDLDLLKAEREQAQELQESVANCDQIKSEIERLQRKQQETARGKVGRRRRRLSPKDEIETRFQDGSR